MSGGRRGGAVGESGTGMVDEETIERIATTMAGRPNFVEHSQPALRVLAIKTALRDALAVHRVRIAPVEPGGVLLGAAEAAALERVLDDGTFTHVLVDDVQALRTALARAEGG